MWYESRVMVVVLCLCGYFLPNMTRLNRCDERQRGNYTPKRPYAPHFCLFFAHFRPKQCLLSVCLLGNPFIPTSHALGERCLHLCSVCCEKCAPYPPDYGNPATFYRHPRNRDTIWRTKTAQSCMFTLLMRAHTAHHAQHPHSTLLSCATLSFAQSETA